MNAKWIYLLLLLPLCLRSADTAPTPATPELDAQSQEVLSTTAAFYASMPACRFSLRLLSSITNGDDRQESKLTYVIALQRPDKFRMEMMSDENMATVVSDGESLYRYVPALASYTRNPAPDDLNIERMFEQDNSGIGSFLAALFSDKPYAKLLKGVKKVEYAGHAEVDGTACHKLQFRQEAFDWTMWIEKGPEPYVRKISPDMSRVMAKAAEHDPGLTGSTMQIDGIFDHWKKSVGFKQAAFNFIPPPVAKKIQSFDQTPAQTGDKEPAKP